MKKRINDENFSCFRKLTRPQVVWLIENYLTMTNAECAKRLNLKEKTLISYAYKLDLKKSREHIKMLRQKQAINTNNKRWKK